MRIRLLAFSIALVACGVASAQNSDAWRWSVTPYLWGSDVSTDVTFPSGQAVGGELSFEDILDKLDFAAMVHVEGHRGDWGMLFDATYVDMSDDATNGPVATTVEAKVGLYELGAVYSPGAEKGPFSGILGVRIVESEMDLRFLSPPIIAGVTRSADESYTDFLVGARYLFSFNDRWGLNLRADTGVGDTEKDWSLHAQLGWRFGRGLSKAVLFGWRHLELEFEQDGRETEVTMDGPLLGVMFGW